MLSSAQIARIDAIFQNAADRGRRCLYEFEVYCLLSTLGLATPRHLFVADPADLTADSLAPFMPKAVAKIVSPDIAHKSKYGGVRVAATDDPLYFRWILSTMRDEVLSHFGDTAKPRIDGFLIAEFIPFTQALGNEVLIGIKEDPAFGPIVTLSKGGDDAEFFARWYDPANLAPAPLSLEDAEAISSALKIRHKFEAEGHPDYCAQIATALRAVAALAESYSFIAATPPGYYLTQMDINPFVFAGSGPSKGRLVAVDGFAVFATDAERERPAIRPDTRTLRPFFRPHGIAVAGVSSSAGKYSMARNIVELLADMDRTDLYCLNPKGGSAVVGSQSFTLYRSITELPRACELFVFAAPAQGTIDFLRSVPDGASVILISGLPINLRLEEFRAEVESQKRRGVRVIGPNCMGIFFAPTGDRKGVNTLFIGEERLKLSWTDKTNVALFTQSGAMAITAVERTQNAPCYRAIVSFGNKIDVNVPDLIRYFRAEPSVAVMALYLEGLGPGEGRSLYELAKRADKPLIVYKAGRTEAGAKAAASHTAALSGDYDIFAAACRSAGAVLIDELPDFYNAVKTFSMLSGRRPLGFRTAGIVNAGLDATMGADLLGGLTPAVYRKATLERLRELNRHGLLNVGASFLDVTPMTDDRLFADIAETVLADPLVDCAFIALVPHVETLKTTDDVCADSDALGPLLVQAAARSGKPIVVSVNSGNHYQGLVRVLEEGGLPVFPDIRSAMRALDCFCAWCLRGN